jgi:hypothetical protein
MIASCENCAWLKIKDFITGYCGYPGSDRGVVQPEDSCGAWMLRQNKNSTETEIGDS